MTWLGFLYAQSDAQAVHASSTMQMVMWIGMLVLCVTFLVMTWTRLGQARPLTKCLTLSVFAHVLIGVLFYGTRILGIDFPIAGLGDNVVSFIDDERLLAAAEESVVDVTTNESASAVQANESDPNVVTMPDPAIPVPMPNMQPNESEIPPMQTVDPRPVIESDVNDSSVAEMEPPLELNEGGFEEPAVTKAELPMGVSDETPMESETVKSPMERIATAPPTESITQIDDDPNSVASSAQGNLVAVKTTVPNVPVESVAKSVKRLDDTVLPAVYKKRWQSEATRGRAFGASIASEEAVQSALAWLAANQHESGKWIAQDYGAGREPSVQGQLRGKAGLHADTGITGLALLAFMGAGETHLDGDYRKTVQRGLEWLLGQQSGDGNLSGKATLYARMYCHAMATMAVCEALALTGDPRIQPYAQRAIDYTVNSQDSMSGGWRYQPKDTGDMSQCGWQLLAVKSAQFAGISIPEKVRSNMIRFVQSCSAGKHHGLSSYRPNEKITATMTAEAMACRLWLDSVDSDEQLNEAAQRVMQELPGSARCNLYLNYYGSFVLKRVGGEQWQTWNQAMQSQLLESQRVKTDSELDATLAGSWDPTSVWAGYGGRVYSTAMAVLCLEVYYRFD